MDGVTKLVKKNKTKSIFIVTLLLSGFFFLNNCVGITPEKVNINKIKKERKLPNPNFFIPDAMYVTAGNGYRWDLRQFMDFRFWSPPYFNTKEVKQHKSAVHMALTHAKDFEIVSWYSESRDAGGKVRPIFTYQTNASLCRDYQSFLYINKKARSKTFTACKGLAWHGLLFNYWDWPGAEKYLN